MSADLEFENRYGPHFTYDEFRCKCDVCRAMSETNQDDGSWHIEPEFQAFMFKLIKLRNLLGWPFSINSGYRCPDYNDQIYVARGSDPGTHRAGPHTIGAADVRCSFERAYQLMDLATAENMGVGPRQHGPVANRFIHVDNQGPRIWTY
jgi:hypothetical protein